MLSTPNDWTLELVFGNIGNTDNILQPYLMITFSPEDLAI